MNTLVKSVLVVVGVVAAVSCFVFGAAVYWFVSQVSSSAGPRNIEHMQTVPSSEATGRPTLADANRIVTTSVPSTVDPATLVENAEPIISEFMAENGSMMLGGDGTFEDWIEIHNPSTQAVDLKGYFLTDDNQQLTKWRIPNLKIAAGGFAVVSAAGADDRSASRGANAEWFLQGIQRLRFPGPGQNRGQRMLGGGFRRHQTNFKLSLKGEYLALVRPDGTTVVHDFRPEFPKQVANVSYGLVHSGHENRERKFAALRSPTPGGVNSEAVLGFAPKIEISQPHGYYENRFEVMLACNNDEFEIRFTLDGSAPSNDHGLVYTQPIPINKTTVLRAAAFRDGYKTLQPQTATYLFLDDVVEQSSVPPHEFPQERRVNSQQLRFGMRPDVVQLYSKPSVVESLKALPALCICTSNDNLFDPRLGIYVNAQASGRSWERPASLELLHPDGSEGFQIDAGLRIRGAYSRRGSNPKHALRMIFRKEYGGGQLKYRLFGDEGADEFDHIDFRTSLNYSWAEDNSSQNNFLRDVFSRDSQRDMGQPYTRSRFYHMFLNGQYWGIYQTQERAVAAYAATYFGGKKEDYDVVKNAGEFPDGNEKAYTHFYNEVRNGINDERYFRLQGLNVDGTPNPKYKKLLDVDNLIDYMAITYYTGDRDGPSGRYLSTPNNYIAIYNRTNPDGWKYFEHDSEHSMDTGDQDMTFPFKPVRNAQSFNPHWLHDQLVANGHYLKRFRQRIDHHFGINGALSYERALARLEQREQEVSHAVVAHAARWGSTSLNYDRWQQSVGNTKRWMEERTDVVYDQLRERGWYPGPRMPLLSKKSSTVERGTRLYLVAQGENDQIYYTLDGTDPRGVNNKPSAASKRVETARRQQTMLVKENARVRALIPTSSSLGLNWTQPKFSMGANWLRGHAPVGYETNSGYEDIISLDVRRRMFRQNTSLYVRYDFSTKEPVQLTDDLILRMKFDDGFIAYLDGNKIASHNAPTRPAWNSFASADNSDTKAVNFAEFSVKNSTLPKGKHVLAIHALDGTSSSDFLMAAELVIRTFHGESISINEPVKVSVRSYDPSEELWSGIRAATFRPK